MKIFSAPGAIFPGIGPPTDDPPLLLADPTLDLVQAFVSFAAFVNAAASVRDAATTSALGSGPVPARTNLPRAMYTVFIDRVLQERTLGSQESLYDLIVKAYSKIQASGTALDLYHFSLYFFIALFHFEVWYCRELASDSSTRGPLLNSNMRAYVTSVLKSTYLHNGIIVSDAFYQSPELKRAFLIDGSLKYILGMLDSNLPTDTVLDDITRRSSGNYVNLAKRGGGSKLKADEASIAKRQFVETFRTAIQNILVSDVRRILAMLAGNPSPLGKALADMFGNFRQYALGDGTSTTSMFDISRYGLIFFDYEINDVDDPVRVCRPNKANIPLIDESDPPGTSVTFLFYGLDFDFRTISVGNPSALLPPPTIELKGYNGTTAVAVANPVRSASDKWDHLPLRSGGVPAASVQLRDAAAPATSLHCDINSALIPKQNVGDPDNWEEMIYIVFKHNIPDPRLPPLLPAILLSAEWNHLDNQFQKILVPASGQTPEVIQPADFEESASELAALAAALVANPGFNIDVVLIGFGIGFFTGSTEKKIHKLIKSPDQADHPNAPGYDDLRYAHGWLEWHPPNANGPGWLTGHVGGFVSPLRCTWEDHFPPAKKQLLDTFLKDLVTKDSQNRPVYNCVLSSFRAFSLFHAMIERLVQEVDATGSPSAGTVKQKLIGYLKNEASVRVTLPTGVMMQGGVLNYSNIQPFY